MKNESLFTTNETVIVIGAGPVGVYFVNELLKRSPHTQVKLFGNEFWNPHTSIHLTDMLSGKFGEGYHLNGMHAANDESLQTYESNPIQSIDTDRSVVVDSQGVRHTYSQLVLAVGASPKKSSIPGIKLDNVLTFRGLSDTKALLGRKEKSQRIVVIGGGLLGIEAAKCMNSSQKEVICVEHTTRLMFDQLDDHASVYLEDHLETLGIGLRVYERVVEIRGDGQVNSVLLSSGEVIECDTVIVATGITPNLSLAIESGIHVGNGIAVDDNLQTNIPNIYAIGKCIEHRDQVCGLVTPGYEQGAVLAERLSGKDAHYKGAKSVAGLKVAGYPVYSLGETGTNASSVNEWIYRDTKNKIYRKLVLKNHRLQGVVAMGEWPSRCRLREAIEKKRRIWPWQRQRFVTTGELWGDKKSEIQSWAPNAVVCSCKGITRGTLTHHMNRGANTAVRLCDKTGASSVCGSCRPLLHDLTRVKEQPAKESAWPHLFVNSALCTLVAAVMVYWLWGVA